MENNKTHTLTKVMTTEQQIEQTKNKTQSLYNLLDAWADTHSLFPIEFQKLLYEIHLKIDESERELHFLKKYQKEEREMEGGN